jgi:hypothetical protein
MTLQNAISQVQTYMRLVSGIKAAPEYPMDGNTLPFPFVVSFAHIGTVEIGPAGVSKGLHDVMIEVHVARKDLPKDIQSVMRFSDSVPSMLIDKLLNDNQWNHTISTFDTITYTFGPMIWAGTETLGFRFIVHNIKIQTDL